MKLGPARMEAVRRIRDAALELARTSGAAMVISGQPLTEVCFEGVKVWLTSWRADLTGLDVWYEGAGGGKVLNMAWTPSGEMQVTTFRRGEWEPIILNRAKQSLN